MLTRPKIMKLSFLVLKETAHFVHYEYISSVFKCWNSFIKIYVFSQVFYSFNLQCLNNDSLMISKIHEFVQFFCTCYEYWFHQIKTILCMSRFLCAMYEDFSSYDCAVCHYCLKQEIFDLLKSNKQSGDRASTLWLRGSAEHLHNSSRTIKTVQNKQFAT